MKKISTQVIVLILLGFALSFFNACQSKSPPLRMIDVSAYKRVLVLVKMPNPAKGKTLDIGVEAAINTTLQDIIVQKGYEVLDRSNAIWSMAELDFDAIKMGILQGETNVPLPPSTNGAFVVTLNSIEKLRSGSLGRDIYTVNLSIQLVDLHTKSVLWAKSAYAKSDGILDRIIPKSFSEGTRKSLVEVMQEAIWFVAEYIPEQVANR